jgi:hypothetical protein
LKARCGDCRHWRHRADFKLMRTPEGECHAPIPQFLERIVDQVGCVVGFHDGETCKVFDGRLLE